MSTATQGLAGIKRALELGIIMAALVLVVAAHGDTRQLFTLAGETLLYPASPETSHLVFVTEYVRELAAIENIRTSAAREQTQSVMNETTFFNGIHFSTLTQLELASQIAILSGMHMNDPFDQLIPDIIAFDRKRIALHQTLIDISTAFVGGPKPGVDYGTIGSGMPKVRAGLDYIDQSLFDMAPWVFSTLIDLRPDSDSHMSHLVITKAERATLIEHLTNAFGPKLDQTDQDYVVSAASVLKTYLLKGFKCSDDPWTLGSPAPATSQPEEVPRGKFDWYVEAIKNKVAQNWYLKELYGSTPAGLTVFVQFTIGKKGQPRNISIATSSGNHWLDQSCLNAVKRVDTFGPLPAGYKEQSLNVLYHCTAPGQ
jgi:TonB family protein